LKVVNNLERILAIELMNSAQALNFRRPLKTSATLEKLWKSYREVVAEHLQDRFLAPDIEASLQFLRTYPLA
jgi:histidine ammonia-lyase